MSQNSRYAWGDRMPQLDGVRIRLRALEDRDVESLYAIFSDQAVIQYWSSPAMTDLIDAHSLLASIRKGFIERELFEWGIATRDTDEVVGTCTLYNLEETHRRADLGFALRRASWGQGFASEAIGLAIGFAFETLHLHRLEADADPDNARSILALERQGFRREGYLRERWHHLGELRDAVFLGLLRHEWVRPAR